MSASCPSSALRSLALALGLVLASGPAAGAQELDAVRDRVEGLRDDLDAATQEYEAVWAEVETVRTELLTIEAREQHLEGEARRLTALLGDRARSVFMHGSTATLQSLLAARGPQNAVERAGLIAALQFRQGASLEDAVATRTSLDQARRLADDRRAELHALEARLEQQQARLADRLEDAEAELASLQERADRQRTIDRGEQSGVYACPMNPRITHFRDTWGHPRSGGRRHKGTDVFGPMGAEVYAITGGTIARHTQGGLGGISLYLQGDDGNVYYYTHLQGYAPLGAVGTRVEAGDLVAYNGDTGNARGGAPHIHFERKPGGGASVNPYPFLAAACF
ncbi:murein hydrolase activator EnvC [Egicoccus sp. AB-alg6-2]|uniref:murein hydrolase activator EnvC family protein n=1 Tax=Egicoccus sp. AB-alg6-2 TaxID=3242692 RepID=UPI00359E5A08